MNKIKNIFNKNNLKIIIPSIVLLVLLIVLFIYLKEYQINNYRDKLDNKFYQYFDEDKLEYTAEISFNKKKVIKAFVPKEYNINFDSTPIYYSEQSKVILPKNMNLILPLKKKNQYKITEFTYIEKINNIFNLVNDNYNKNIDHFILYDGKDLYLFSDSVTFKLNGKDITLSPLSYLIAYPDTLIYYDYELDTYNKVSNTNEIIISNDYYKLNVSYDNIEYPNNKTILTSNIDYLSILKEN